jgi:2-amino-4-hydroxy-6-hydroxymethyldihydropteridine diphosphokinase
MAEWPRLHGVQATRLTELPTSRCYRLTMRAATAYVGLGGNLDHPDRTIALALDAIARADGILQVSASALYRTTPVDATGPDFCNAVARVSTHLDPDALLRRLLHIEAAFGRTRPHRNAPRTLDLDLITYGDTTVATPSLTLPHPRAHQRAFVLVPLCELDPTVPLGPVGAPRRKASDWLAERDRSEILEVAPW